MFHHHLYHHSPSQTTTTTSDDPKDFTTTSVGLQDTVFTPTTMKIIRHKHRNRRHTIMPPPPVTPAPPGGSDGGKTVVVAVRMDQQSRELLTWALVKVALPGDHVLALHVAADGGAAVGDALFSIMKELESVIAVYEGFCNLKQINLKLKICRGASIRRAVVAEAQSAAASALILGVAKHPHHHVIGSSSTSIAKYCAKKLPAACSVLAVANGKIAFQSAAAPPPPLTTSASPSITSLLATHRSGGFLARRTVEPGSPDAHQILSKLEASRSQSCSVCTESSDGNSADPGTPSSSTASVVIPDLPEAHPGLSLLRRVMAGDKRSVSPSPERSRISVGQWAIRLPSRHSMSPAVHPDPKHPKPVPNPEPNSDAESRAMVTRVLESIQEKYSSVCRLFGYQELVQATSDFSPDNMVGKGGSSRVYKGRLPDGKELAVKILKPSEDALQEFVSEVEIITTLHHKNIVALFGFCFENDDLILVYDYLSRGSLEEILHGEKGNKSDLSWMERHKIAEGVAEALDYLHCGDNSQSVIHRDVKSSNILLSDDFMPKLCDFGFAQWASTSSTHITCNDVAGTFGYLAPEYFMYGKVNEKIDVYAFGVVLLELISGRKPVDTGCSRGRESLVMWAKPILQGGKVKELVDPTLGDEYDNNQMERMVLAASLCIRRSPQSRPHIALILKLLQGDKDVRKWARSEINGGSGELDGDDETPTPDSNIQSHINLALFDIDDETNSVSSADHCVDFINANTSLEEYLQGRWSRSSSFD